MQKFVFGAIALLSVAVSVYAAPEITITSTPELPGKNFIGNETFASGSFGSWGISKSVRDLVSIDKTTGVGDSSSIKIVGEPTRSPNIYHRLRSNVPFKAGEPYYVRYYSKRVNSNPKYRGSGALAFMPVNGKTYRYAQVPEHNPGDSDWGEYSHYGTIPVDAVYATFYLCYYKQSGYALFDNVEFRCGWAELNISVKGGGLQQIVVRNSVTGVILRENIKGSEYTKKVKVPAFGSNAVEVLDRTGEVTSKLYPENIDKNVPASDTVLPLTPVKRVNINKSTESFTFALPAISGKKVYLAFLGRIHRKAGVAGYTNAIKIKVNGKNLGLANLVKPGKVLAIKSKPQRKVNMINSRGFIFFYNNNFVPISEQSDYYPTTFDKNNPFDFKLDITKNVEEGLNVVDLQVGDFKDTWVVLDDLRVVIE